jgi:hypothetical protein
MKFNLQESVNFILDPNKLPALRAIELFAFLIALHLGKSDRKICGQRATDDKTSLVLNVSEKTIVNARILAGMKFLDQIEQNWIAKTGRDRVVLSELIKDPEYEEIINRIIFANGGWRKLRFVYSVRFLERKLRRWKTQARNVARIVEFSFRFEPNPKKRRQLGGVTMAIDIVTACKYFPVSVKDSQLEKSWSDLQSAAPFFYLIYVKKQHSFFLKKLAGKAFARRFARMAADQGKLTNFFGQYNSLIGVLRQRGYKYTPLLLPVNARVAPMSEFPFRESQKDQAAVLDEIRSYRKG